MTVLPGAQTAEGRAQSWLRLTEVWPSLAITAIWAVVALTALFGPDITSSTPGGTTSTVPSGVVVGLFATIASWAIAKYGFRARGPR